MTTRFFNFVRLARRLASAARRGRGSSRTRPAFTLVELLVTLTVIAILSSLSLAGLAVVRQRVKADRTETTIRKIHEIVMQHYESFANRTPLAPSFSIPGQPTLETVCNKGLKLIARRRMMTLELPDGWRDLQQQTGALVQVTGTNVANLPLPWTSATFQTGVSKRFSDAFSDAELNQFGVTLGDSECLWLSVMQGGYADPGIIGHFREDEFGDRDGDGRREFIDGWGKSIRFLRWAPGFESRYQPAAASNTKAHDAFDLAGVDPLARGTLFPLIYSMGPDGEPDIMGRDQQALVNFSYPEVGYDPYFANLWPLDGNRKYESDQKCHLRFSIRNPAITVDLGSYTFQPVSTPAILGARSPSSANDDVHNHAMSR